MCQIGAEDSIKSLFYFQKEEIHLETRVKTRVQKMKQKIAEIDVQWQSLPIVFVCAVNKN